jgi:hypothetical protein
MASKKKYLFDYHVSTIIKTIESCDFTSIENAIATIQDDDSRNVIRELIPKLKSYAEDLRQKKELQQKVYDLSSQLDQRIYDDMCELPKNTWKILEKGLNAGLKTFDAPENIIKTVITRHFTGDVYRFFLSDITDWSSMYDVDFQAEIDKLVESGILLQSAFADCPECNDGHIDFDYSEETGTCVSCNNTFPISELEIEYDYLRGPEYENWVNSTE